ncbi:MAG: tRNA pseudouridine(13) synthase TruD [SAR324 cluster bacterium]|nr:tRNA pseudouridine(13) synthase TruD [SAR324 cluster bacterium]
MFTIDQKRLNIVTLNPSQYGELGLFCQDLPGLGGHIKRSAEDFEVEEIPAYEPCGEGEHLFLWVEKRDLSSDQMMQHIARGLDIPSREIGSAGKKDKTAVTRQFVSVPRKAADRVDRLESDNLRVLSSCAHTNKYAVGHSKGNRFKIVIRDLAVSDPVVIEQIIERVKEMGFPNFYGIQRFGVQGDTADIGFRILNGDEASLPKQWRIKIHKKFALSAAQSLIFNRYLLWRLIEKGSSLMLGDVVFKKTGGIFRVEDLETEQRRYLAQEFIPAGPIFGKKTYPATDEALAFENEILSRMKIDRAVFSDFGKMLLGTRRAIFCRPEGLLHRLSGKDLLLEFSLPAGSYATVLLAEFMNSGVDS